MNFAIQSVVSVALGKVYFGAVWDDLGWRSLIFPEADKANVLRRLRARHPDAKRLTGSKIPAKVRAELKLVSSYLEGKKANLNKIRLNLERLPPFHQRVYREARNVERGSIRSYQDLAKIIGKSGAARAVGQAMAKNPLPIIVPCHRVLASSNKIGGFTAPGGVDTKKSLLKMEGYRAPALIKFPAGLHPETELASKCRRLSRVIDEIGEYVLPEPTARNVYESLFRSILFQQLNGTAARTIMNRVKANFKDEIPTPVQL